MRIYLETERLALRPFSGDEADVERLYALDSDPEVMRFLNGGRPTSRERIRTKVLPQLLHDHPCTGTRGYWSAEERATGTWLGWFEFRPLADDSPAEVELGYRLNRASWGRGYATEGARALIARGFAEHPGLMRVTADTMTVNTASRRVMEKSGLTFVRHFTDEWPDSIEGSEEGDVAYELTRADWSRQNTALTDGPPANAARSHPEGTR
ncbi:GNAT family N-acetyltransferase [Streptomyces sp. NPDC004111]|uniref:GNAT family N-acetyltransferase n=1 Tax=Streptomyces sp. NPDC004111 TaxID=3364690 RepID=UPI0036BF2E91